VYEWAGELREVNIAKGGTSFERLDKIHAGAARLASSLESENFLRGLPKNEFVDRLADYYTGWNALHPFREGNGRATLEFMRQMAHNAGYDFDRSKIDQSPGRWYNAAKEGFNGNNQPLKNIFTDIVRPLVAVDVERLSLDEAAKIHPELVPLAVKARALSEQFEAAYKDVPNKAAFLMGKVHGELVKQLDSGKPVAALPQPVRAPVMQSVVASPKM
jgi:cell filamentation protein